MYSTMMRIVGRQVVANTASFLSKMPPKNPKFWGRMFSMQESIPRLPVPALDQTLQKYLRVVKPFLDEDSYLETEQAVDQFKRDPGPTLQSLLEKRAQSETNWLSDWWRNIAYLDYRLPVVINSNPGIIFPKQDYTGIKGQLRFAAKFIAGVLDYKVMVDEQTLPVEKLGGQPLCMMQYYKFISACRVPGKKRDSFVVYPPNEPNAPSHIVVICNNHMFELEVYGKGMKPLNIEQIYQRLQIIVEQSKHAGEALGILTTENRDNWSNSYHKLIKDKVNKSSLEKIQRSICVLCLDKPGLSDNDPNAQRSFEAGQMLHGSGSSINSANRWFDKTLQFIIGADGVCGLNYEHTSAEGPPIISIVDHVLKFCEKNEESGLPATGISDPKKLKFNIPSSVAEDIEKAKTNIDSLIADLELNAFTFDHFGKNFPKSMKLSPDGFIQVALQVAYYRIYKQACSTYESGSLRRFQLGRTDTIRSSTMESLEFSKKIDDNAVGVNEKVELLKQAVKAHADYSKITINGQGVDRHLLGLKLIALENGHDVPKLHQDYGYSKAMHIILSTSQVPAKSESVLCFGPVVPDGYGVCYNPQDKKIIFCVTTFNNSPDTHTKKLSASLVNSLCDMRNLLMGETRAKL